MNLLFRNFQNTLRRYKVASILNILGLSIAFAAFAIIMMQVRYDLTYDKFHSDHERIFRLELEWQNGEFMSSASYPVIDLIDRTFPEVETSGAIYSDYKEFNLKPANGGEYFRTDRKEVTPGLFEVFDFEWVSGTPDGFTEPNTMVIPQSFAQRVFPNGQAVGQHLLQENNDSVQLRVIGVYRDFPQNSTLKNDVYINRVFNQSDQMWGHGIYRLFVLLKNPAQAEELAAQVSETVAKNQTKFYDNPKYRFVNIHDIHYSTDLVFDQVEKINKSRTYLFLLIAVLIVVIAMINFTNFSNALIPARLKGVNTQKVLGCPDGQIRRTMLIEAVGLCGIAAVIAVWLVYAVSLTGISNLMIAEIRWAGNTGLLLGLFATALLAGIIAGIYPAVYITSFPTALVLKGSFGLSPSGKKLRTVLIGFQYIISLVLIMVALLIHQQSNYMKTLPVGFDRENLLQSQIPNAIGSRSEAFRERLLQNPNIREVGFSNGALVSEMVSHYSTNFNDEQISYDNRAISDSYTRTIGFEITEGRDFTPADVTKEHPGMLFNETARQKYGLKVGDRIGRQEVLGFFSDINYKPVHTGVEPLALEIKVTDSRFRFGYAFYRIGGTDVRATIQYIEQVIREMSPGYENANLAFVDQHIGELYGKEDKLAALITLFSLLAIVISLIGVFGLVLFETQYRRKEIGIRKVHGATIDEILGLLNKGFVRIVLICFLIATPIAYYAVTKWQEGFTYKSPIHWWIFTLAFLSVLLITLLTVTLQSYRAATENPVNSIKTQ